MGKAWEKSGSLELDTNAVAAAGALAYFYEGGTTTPLTTYEDSDENTPATFPLEADANGRWPLTFIPFIDTYDVKVTTSVGSQLYYFRELPNPDPVDASASVDENQLIQTGDIIFSPKSGTRAGFVRCNGRTIGSASSGATERANADCADLYAFLWNNFADSILAVTSGRGVSATADFGANKPIALFDLRGGHLTGLDDMGNTAASQLASVPFSTGGATTGGSRLGENTHALSEAELASHDHDISITSGQESAGHTHAITVDNVGSGHNHTVTDPTHDHGVNGVGLFGGGGVGFAGGANASAGVDVLNASTGITISSNDGTHTHGASSGFESAIHTHLVSGTSNAAGSGTAHNVVSLGILGNWMIKL